MSICFLVSSFILLFSIVTEARGISTVGDYANRLDQARRITIEVIEQESPAPVVVQKMTAIKQLLPAAEEVGSGGSIVRVDNSWLHDLTDNVVKNADGDIEQRHSMLREIADRLYNLQQQVTENQKQSVTSSQDQRALLESILARPEYQPEEKRESFIQKLLRRVVELIFRLLANLFGRSPALAPGSGLITVFRILIILAATAALAFGVIKLMQRLRGRSKQEGESKAREVLGEEIAEDATAAEIFAKAMEIARRGEYRAAIRRAYIALLCELEERDKLRLHRSKTNRDYLEALRSEQQIFPTFSAMTNSYEHVWYGEERATEKQFNEFTTLYRETVK
jgi:hypothetical protein